VKIKSAIPVVLLVILGGGALNGFYRLFTAEPESPAARGDVMLVANALAYYQVQYGEPLVGDQAHIVDVLRGNNPRKFVFIDVPPEQINKNGELIDPWGSPYKLDELTNPYPHVYSFGPNKKDELGTEESDDIASWRYGPLR
jgi:hypothetical protein